MIKLTKAELLYAQLWPALMGIAVGFATTVVHRGRTGQVPWGLILAWALIVASGIYIRAARGRSQSTTFTIVAIALPFAIAAFSSNAKLLIVSDGRSYTWLIGHVVLALITMFFGAATRAHTHTHSLEAPQATLAAGNAVAGVRKEGDHVNR